MVHDGIVAHRSGVLGRTRSEHHEGEYCNGGGNYRTRNGTIWLMFRSRQVHEISPKKGALAPGRILRLETHGKGPEPKRHNSTFSISMFQAEARVSAPAGKCRKKLGIAGIAAGRRHALRMISTSAIPSVFRDGP